MVVKPTPGVQPANGSLEAHSLELQHSSDVIERVFDALDTDKSDTIQFGEFLKCHDFMFNNEKLGELSADTTVSEEMENRFRHYDRNHDQTLDKAEFHSYMSGILCVIG